MAQQPVRFEGTGRLQGFDIQFDQVCFAYPMRRHFSVLNHISFEAKYGQVTALVGMSGAGKSTLFKLLMGNYTDYEGQILIGGDDLKKLNIEKLRQSTAVVSHQVGIFPTTIRDNIKMGEDISDEVLMDAARSASIETLLSHYRMV